METGAKEKLYRFELSYDGEPQGIGLLAGIGELGFSEEFEEWLLHDFDQYLPISPLTQSATFWFREDGLRRFQQALDMLIQEVREKGWDVDLRVKEMEMDAVIYQDIYQVALNEKVTSAPQGEVRDFSNVKELLDDIMYSSEEKNILDIIDRALSLGGYVVYPPEGNCITIYDKSADLHFRLLIESTAG